MCTVVYIHFPHFYWGLPWPPYLKLQPCTIYVLLAFQTLHFFILFSALLFRTDILKLDYINGLPHYSGFLLCLVSERPEDLRGNASLDIYSLNSLLAESSRDGWFTWSEITVFVTRLLHLILSLSLFWWLLHPFDPSSLRGSNWVLPTVHYPLIYLYFAHTFVNSLFRKHSSKYLKWVFHLFPAKTLIESSCLSLTTLPIPLSCFTFYTHCI